MSAGWGTPTWMQPEPAVGETFVQGKTPQTARALLNACDELGVDRIEVRTITGGFIVPNAVYDTAAPALIPTDEQF